VEILACTTCLEYFDLTEKLLVSKLTTMLRSIQSILNCDVVSLQTKVDPLFKQLTTTVEHNLLKKSSIFQ